MKRKIGVIVIFLLLSGFAFGDERVKVGVSSGILGGKITELVYDSSRLESNMHLSELYWDLYAMPYSGINFSAKLNTRFYISFSGLFAYPVKNGSLDSYSYLNNYAGENGWIYPGKDIGVYTNYSKRTVTLKHYYDFSFAVGGVFNLPFDFELYPYFKYEYGNLMLAGIDGYEQNARNKWKVERFSGTVLDYQIISRNMYFGFKTDFSFLNPLIFSASYELSPFFGFIRAYDNHYLEEKSFKDVLDNTVKMCWIFTASYKFKGFQKIDVDFKISYVPETYGEFQTIYDGDGGIKETITDLSIVYSVYF